MNRAALALLLCWCAPALADDADDLQAAATEFYSVTTGLRGFGLPDSAALARLGPTLSTSLSSALNAAMGAQARWMARNKNAPALFDGDIFSSLADGATGFSVGTCVATGQSGRCDIALVRDAGDGRPVRWTDHLVLVKQGPEWRVDDIAYGGNWAFANSGTLRETIEVAQGIYGSP